MVGLTAESSTLVTALTTAFQGCVTDILDAITSILPICLPVLAAFAVVGVGIKIFKKVTTKA